MRLRALLLVKRAVWVLAVLCVSPLATAQGLQGFGAIGGTVVDSSGAALPGATVALSNPGVIGGAQEQVTDGRGAYQFSRLVPGTYSVRASLAGFSASLQEGIVVNANATARVDVRLEIGALAETIVVSGQSPLLDTTSTYRQTVLDQKTLEAIPTGKDIWSVARLVPGLVTQKFDVGGTESMYATNIYLHGSLKEETNYLIDGVDITDSYGGGTSALYPDPGMFEQINYQGGNAPAELDRGGVVLNMVTRTGSNTFHGRFTSVGSNTAMSSNNLTPEQSADLLAWVPARVRAVNPNFVATTKIKSH